jgi:hypothetical protein
MKNNSSFVVLALVFLAHGTSGKAQDGYIRFVDSLTSYLSNRSSHIEVEDLVFSNLNSLNVRRLVEEEDEIYFFQRGYDLNQDKLLNEKDGFEWIDNEKFSPWGYYLELYPCKGKQSIYLEARGIDQNKKVYQIQKMLRLRDVKTAWLWCKSNLKFQLPPGDSSITIQARELIRNNVYELCIGQAYNDTIGLTALDKFRLRCPGNMGKRSKLFGLKLRRKSKGKPLVSEPNISQSLAANGHSCKPVVPCVLKAKQRAASGCSLCRKADQSRWRLTLAYSW